MISIKSTTVNNYQQPATTSIGGGNKTLPHLVDVDVEAFHAGCFLRNKDRRNGTVVEYVHYIADGDVQVHQITYASLETSADIRFGDIVPAVTDTLCDPLDGLPFGFKVKEQQVYAIA